MTPPTVTGDVKADACAAAKAGLDRATQSGLQSVIDVQKQLVTQTCGAGVLAGSLAAVAVAIYAVTF